MTSENKIDKVDFTFSDGSEAISPHIADDDLINYNFELSNKHNICGYLINYNFELSNEHNICGYLIKHNICGI